SEAEIPIEPGTKPVDRNPYRANPRTQQVIDSCVNTIEEQGIIEKFASPWG
ncbi:unnamed protein product, partial [Choristocarpus tenellus]